jgi:hypothetical protein
MAITLKDRLSQLTYREACKLLGPEGETLIRQGGRYPIELDEQIIWGDNSLKLNLGEAIVTIYAVPEGPKFLRFSCSECTIPCEHVGAAFSFILEEKLSLGLSAPPVERRPVESLSDAEMIRQAIDDRKDDVKVHEPLRIMDRLYHCQPFFREKLPCCSERLGARRFLLLLS